MADVPQSGVFTSNTSSRSTHWLALAVVSRPIWQVPFVTAIPPTVTCFQSFDEAHVPPVEQKSNFSFDSTIRDGSWVALAPLVSASALREETV